MVQVETRGVWYIERNNIVIAPLGICQIKISNIPLIFTPNSAIIVYILWAIRCVFGFGKYYSTWMQ